MRYKFYECASLKDSRRKTWKIQKVEKTATVHKKSVVSITTLKDIQRKKNKKTKNVQGVTKNRQIQSQFYKTAKEKKTQWNKK